MGHRLTNFCRASGCVALLASALIFVATSAEAAWRTSGYPDPDRHLITAKDAHGTAAFNFICEPSHNTWTLELTGKTSSTLTVITLTVDGKPIATHASLVGTSGPLAMMEFYGSDTDGARWLNGIASATSDVTMTTSYGGAAHFSAEGARDAATTVIEGCKLR